MWQSLKTQIVTTLKNQIVAKFKDLNCDKTQNFSSDRTENSNSNKNKKASSEKSQFLTKSLLVRTTWHFDNGWDVLGAAICNLAMFSLED